MYFTSLQTVSGSPYLLVFPPNSVCLDKAAGASSATMISSTNCTFSALLNVSSLRRASNSALVLTLYEAVAFLSLVNVFKSWVYSLRRKRVKWANCNSEGGPTYHEATLLYFLCIPLINLSIVYPSLFNTKMIGVNLFVITVDSS